MPCRTCIAAFRLRQCANPYTERARPHPVTVIPPHQSALHTTLHSAYHTHPCPLDARNSSACPWAGPLQVHMLVNDRQQRHRQASHTSRSHARTVGRDKRTRPCAVDRGDNRCVAAACQHVGSCPGPARLALAIGFAAPSAGRWQRLSVLTATTQGKDDDGFGNHACSVRWWRRRAASSRACRRAARGPSTPRPDSRIAVRGQNIARQWWGGCSSSWRCPAAGPASTCPPRHAAACKSTAV